jgi:hypothetical protein
VVKICEVGVARLLDRYAGGPFGMLQQHIAEAPEPLASATPTAVDEEVADLLAKRTDHRRL